MLWITALGLGSLIRGHLDNIIRHQAGRNPKKNHEYGQIVWTCSAGTTHILLMSWLPYQWLVHHSLRKQHLPLLTEQHTAAQDGDGVCGMVYLTCSLEALQCSGESFGAGQQVVLQFWEALTLSHLHAYLVFLFRKSRSFTVQQELPNTHTHTHTHQRIVTPGSVLNSNPITS